MQTVRSSSGSTLDSVTYNYTYDAIGNPLSYYNGYSFTWTQGRRLTTVSGNSKSISYAYNSAGIRIKKTVNGTVTNYMGDGTNNA